MRDLPLRRTARPQHHIGARPPRRRSGCAFARPVCLRRQCEPPLDFQPRPRDSPLDAAIRSENALRRPCSGPKNFRDDEACTFGQPRTGGSYDMAIFGDSHANHYTPAMGLLAQQAGMSGRQITVGGCLALLGYSEIVSPHATEMDCRSLREAMVRFVRENPRLQIAVLAHIGPLTPARRSTTTR